MNRDPIQIWQPHGNQWFRPQPGPLGDHYSAVEVLQAKVAGGPTRVLLVGESVAAGYLLAPTYTPALVLDGLLNDYEVVDLARTNESLASLEVTVEQGLQLEPDVVVMWAGNNWLLRDLATLSPYHRRASHRVELAQALRSGGLSSVQSFVRDRVHAYAHPRLERVARMIQSIGARLVVVIPEVNLIDWDHRQPVTWLPADGVDEWYDAYNTAQEDPGSAARRMIAVDRGSCATSHRTASRTTDLSGDDRLSACRRAVVAATGPLRATMTAPMVTEDVQMMLRQWADRHGFDIVDVASVIERRGELPDRIWFLDYCHHTTLGIEQVMGAVADVISPTTSGAAPCPTPTTLATAAVGALVHTSHRLVSSDNRQPLLRYWRDQALRSDPGARELIEWLIESRLGAAPPVLNPALSKIVDSANSFGFAHGLRPLGVDAGALIALGATPAQLSRIRTRAERAWPADTTWEPAEHLWTDLMLSGESDDVAYHRSIWPRTNLAVVVDKAGAHQIEITARLPNSGIASLHLGTWSVELNLAPTWATRSIEVPAGVVEPGLHRLSISWPLPVQSSDVWPTMLADLASDRPTMLHPVFGEIYSLRFSRTERS